MNGTAKQIALIRQDGNITVHLAGDNGRTLCGFLPEMSQSSLEAEEPVTCRRCRARQPAFIGDLATMHCGSDARSYTVIAVSPSGHQVTLQQRLRRRVDSLGMTDSGQRWISVEDQDGRIEIATRRKGGCYARKGCNDGVTFGVAEDYVDPSF